MALSKRRETRIKLDVPVKLPTVEENLLTMAITLEILSQPGLSMAEVKRLKGKLKALQVFQRLFRVYTRYRKLELLMIRLAWEYEELVTKQCS